MYRVKGLLFYLMVCGLTHCQKPQKTETLFNLLPCDHTGIDFKNHIAENDTFNMVDYFYVYNGGGVAIGDINQDGLPEIYLTGNLVNDRLYLNKGNLQFEDISKSSGISDHGWSTGVTMADVNADGLLDIYVSRAGNYPPEKRKNRLWINQGDLTFTEASASYGLDDEGYTTQSAFFDFDKDGDLDVFLLNHTNKIRNPNEVRPIADDGSGPATDRLYRNDGHTFTDVTIEAGILYSGFGLGVGISDLNDDGWEDIYISNDFIAHDYLYLNNGDGTFSEQVGESFKHLSQFGMGNDLADFNNDGLIDVVTLDMLPPDNYHRKKMAGPMNYNLFEYTLQKGYMPQYMRNTLQVNSGVGKNNANLFCEIGQYRQTSSARVIFRIS